MRKPDSSVILLVDDKPPNILALECLLTAEDRILLRVTSFFTGKRL